MFKILKKHKIFLLLLFSLCFDNSVFSVSIWTKVSQFFDNFYEVVPKKLYRSKQLDGKTLGKYIDNHHFAAVINLRGVNSDKKWWRDEKALCENKNVSFYNIPMSACRLPSKEEIKELINIFENVKGPIYLHCQGGADRTGLATAIYMMLMQDKTNQEALKYLSIQYGHRKYKNSAMDIFVKNWQGRNWALNEYDPAN